MKAKVKLFVVLIVFCSITCWGQKPTNKTKNDTQEITIKKQIIVDDLESQVRDVPFAAVRVFVRYKLAAWLWKDGKDETERAEQLAVKAIDELYEKKTEIPSLYANTLKPDIFALLEINAKERAKKLKAKYDFSLQDELENAQSLFDKKDGDKLAAEKILKSLSSQTELSSTTTFLIDQLQNRKSPELLKILSAILNLEETGKSDFSADSLFLIVYCFRDSTVPNDLRIRFFKIVVNKARKAVQFPDSNAQSAFRLLNSVMPDINATAPDFLTEASVLQAALRTRLSQTENETQEIYKRIEDSSDKLSTLISEAEKTEDEPLKYRLFVMAAEQALKEKKFRQAVDLVEETIENETPQVIPETFRKHWHDQFLNEVISKALKNDDIDSAKYATKKMVDKLSMTEALRQTAIYYFERQDRISATDAFDEALKLTIKTEGGRDKIYTLFNLIKTVQKIDNNRISEATEAAAKTINAIASLDIEDKPGTENYEKYVDSIMVTNWNLLPVISELIKENRSEAVNFINRINKKEIRIIGNFVLSTDSLNFEKNLNKVKEQSQRLN